VLNLAQQNPVEPLRQVAPFLFYALATLTCVSAWAVVLSQNIVRMSVYLLITLAGAAGLYFMLNAEFLAAIQLIVYVGGVLILIVFGVMLTSKSPFAGLGVKAWELGIAVAIGLAMAGLLIFAMVHSEIPVTSGGSSLGGRHQVEMVGHALLSEYLLPFEVAGVLLLVVMIGAAYMARRTTRSA